MTIKKLIATSITIALLASCTTAPPPFKITESDTRFDENGFTRTISDNNRISKKSIAGGVHLDEHGLFINPSVTKTKTGEIAYIALSILNDTQTSTIQGSGDLLGSPKTITFLADNKPLTLDIIGGISQFGTPYLQGQFAYTPVVETGLAKLSKDDYLAITNSTTLAVKIVGLLQSATFENQDIDPNFKPNLKRFYDEKIKI